MLLSEAYAMVPNTLSWITQQDGVEVMTVNLTFPLKDAQTIVNLVEQALLSPEGKDVKLASFSHISSIPAVILPIAELAAVCKKHGVTVLIDGAHALGQIPVNISTLEQAGVDVYISNGHKWLYSPKGSAFMWVRRTLQSQLVPTVISSTGYKDFVGAYEYTGTRDYTAYCSISNALQFRNWVGNDRIFSYLRDTAVWGSNYLAQEWKTETMNPDSMTAAMMNVRFPTQDFATATAVQTRLLQEYNIYIVVYQLQGAVWARLSAQIYVSRDDVMKMAQLVLQLIQQLNAV
eukprot:TRINITY_DN220_c0_g1_i1.p1 TRINITY_DN220_c0_g1~~TRINITY_DN220_c0_g1_i1.p1  ORF type:complete len:290 (+),score=71.31 TRINITY_DN220_c0_g1_i1:421-1290(+)